jgi:hypothetical protein
MHLGFDVLEQLELGGLVLDSRFDHHVGRRYRRQTRGEFDASEHGGALFGAHLALLHPALERLLDLRLGSREVSGRELDALHLQPGSRRDFHDTSAHHAAADHCHRCNTHENLPQEFGSGRAGNQSPLTGAGSLQRVVQVCTLSG